MQYDKCVMMGQQIANRGEYKMLPDVLQAGEDPKCIITGRYNNRNGMLVATDRRLVFLDKQMFGAMETETILYSALSAVEWSTGVMMGSVTLHAHGKANKVTNVEKAFVRYFANYVETKLMDGDTEAVLEEARQQISKSSFSIDRESGRIELPEGFEDNPRVKFNKALLKIIGGILLFGILIWLIISIASLFD